MLPPTPYCPPCCTWAGTHHRAHWQNMTSAWKCPDERGFQSRKSVCFVCAHSGHFPAVCPWMEGHLGNQSLFFHRSPVWGQRTVRGSSPQGQSDQ